VEEPEICYGDDDHPERDRNGGLWSRYTCPRARRLGSSSADSNPYCCINADMDADADHDLYGHTYRDGDVHCYYRADADGDADPYGHAYRDGDAYHHFYRHASADSDARFAYGHADASVSVPA